MFQSYSFNPYLKTLLSDFISLLYPEICVGCGHVLLAQEKIFCLRCEINLPYTHYENVNDNPIERLFWGKTKIENATSCFFFSKKSTIQNIIHAFKYRGNENAAIFLGEKLGEALIKSTRFKSIDVIIPVPLHPSKLKKRGFNQAEKIAQGISHIMQIPVDSTSLERSHNTETQTKKGLFSRWENVNSIFNVSNPEKIAGKHVLLVDDVITSGSTIEACANQILHVQDTKVSLTSLAVANG